MSVLCRTSCERNRNSRNESAGDKTLIKSGGWLVSDWHVGSTMSRVMTYPVDGGVCEELRSQVSHSIQTRETYKGCSKMEADLQ